MAKLRGKCNRVRGGGGGGGIKLVFISVAENIPKLHGCCCVVVQVFTDDFKKDKLVRVDSTESPHNG